MAAGAGALELAGVAAGVAPAPPCGPARVPTRGAGPTVAAGAVDAGALALVGAAATVATLGFGIGADPPVGGYADEATEERDH